jgi:carbonic anhydrase
LQTCSSKITEQVANLLQQKNVTEQVANLLQQKNVTEQVANLLQQKPAPAKEKRYGAGCKPAPAKVMLR